MYLAENAAGVLRPPRRSIRAPHIETASCLDIGIGGRPSCPQNGPSAEGIEYPVLQESLADVHGNDFAEHKPRLNRGSGMAFMLDDFRNLALKIDRAFTD